MEDPAQPVLDEAAFRFAARAHVCVCVCCVCAHVRLDNFSFQFSSMGYLVMQ